VSEGVPQKPVSGAPEARQPRQRRHRARNTLLILLALLGVFHRPLLISLVHAIAIKVAAAQNIRLSLDIEGTIFTNLSLKNIRALPNGHGPTPVESISIDEVTVRYSIVSLVRKGFSEFLSSYLLRNAYIVVKPVEGTSEQKSDLASTLHGLIQQPALFSNRVEIDNLNLVAHIPDGEFAIKSLTLLLDPVLPGALDIGALEVPKVRTWTNLHASSTYANRDMILRGLELDPQIVIRKLELDASRRAEGINRLDVQGDVFGGSADFSLLVRELPGKHRNNVSNAMAEIGSSITNLSLAKISGYFGVGTPAIGTVTDAAIHLTGDPNTPSSWTGSLNTDVGTVHAGSAVIDKANTRLDVSKGWATLGATVFSGSNSVTLGASGRLPDSLDGFAGAGLTGWLNISGADLHHLAGSIAGGRVTGGGTFDLRSNTLRANLDVKAASVLTDDADLSSAEVKARITKLLPAAGGGPDAAPQPPPFEGLQTQLELHLVDVEAKGYAVDAVDAGVNTRDARVVLENLAIRRADDAASASGTYTMPVDMKSWTTAPGSLAFSLNAPSIAEFNAEPHLTGPDGKAQAGGTLTNGPGGYAGDITATVSHLHMEDFAADGLNLDVSIAGSVATIHSLTFALNPADGFSATGQVGLEKPFAYNGALRAEIHDLSKFDALAPGLEGGIAGGLTLNWRGKGDLSSLRSTGDLSLALANGRVQDAQAINVAIAGSYTPEQLNFPTFTIASGKGDLSAVIGARNDLLSVSQILVKQAGKPLLTGSFALPLDLRSPAKPETLIPSNGAIFADLASGDVALDSFFPKGQAPASGTGKVSVSARGTLDQPNIHVMVTGRNLKAKAAATLPPANFDADFALIGPKLSLKARLTDPVISPMEVAGTVPLPLKQVIQQRKIDPQSPVQLSVRLPRSSLSFIPRLVPIVRYVQGDADVSVDIAGTLAKPSLSGVMDLDLAAVRLADPDMPSISGFRGDMRFAGNRLSLGPFGGNLSGGRFDLTGGVTFAPLTNPNIDLHFVSNGDLILRNESVTVRADSNVRVSGPLDGASVTGDIGITKSRFFKEIEILPLELPGRPAPKPPEMPTTTPSIASGPLSNWKLGLKIHTKDPFVIQGNLANGAAIIDLNLGGTGKAPTLDGSVRIENFVASLPFSKLNVTNGYIYFTKDDPFVPRLNIQATSNLQDYNINVFIYGPASDPKTVMSSEPPLQQQDIISLLATGATSATLNSGTGLAGRAAVLLLQSVYHKVFKGKPPSSDNESFASRFQVNVGGVDPRTGQQEVSSSFKLSKELYLIGDLDVGGDLRGMVRYLLRFR
jgi:hypothetical protein